MSEGAVSNQIDCDPVVLGEIAWLLSQAPVQAHLFLPNDDWLVMPAILLGQFHVFYGEDHKPLGAAFWARVSDSVSVRLQADDYLIDAVDWNSGHRLWLMALVAPFGGRDSMLDELRDRVIKDEPFEMVPQA